MIYVGSSTASEINVQGAPTFLDSNHFTVQVSILVLDLQYYCCKISLMDNIS